MAAPNAHRGIRVSKLPVRTQGNLQADTQTEATATAVVIEGLRGQLKRSEAFEHPAVQHELRKLEEQLIAMYEQADVRNPGGTAPRLAGSRLDTSPEASPWCRHLPQISRTAGRSVSTPTHRIKGRPGHPRSLIAHTQNACSARC
jgi:hypothetical protein